MKTISLSLILASSLFSFDQNSFFEQATSYLNTAKDVTVEYGKKARDATVENSILTYLRLKLDKNQIKVTKVTLYEEYKLKIVFSLPDYSKNIIVTINNFDWSRSINEEYLVFNNFDFHSNIPALDRVIKKYLDINEGHILMQYDVTTEVLLSSIKSSSKTSYNSNLYNRKVKIDTKEILDLLYER